MLVKPPTNFNQALQPFPPTPSDWNWSELIIEIFCSISTKYSGRSQPTPSVLNWSELFLEIFQTISTKYSDCSQPTPSVWNWSELFLKSSDQFQPSAPTVSNQCHPFEIGWSFFYLIDRLLSSGSPRTFSNYIFFLKYFLVVSVSFNRFSYTRTFSNVYKTLPFEDGFWRFILVLSRFQ